MKETTSPVDFRKQLAISVLLINLFVIVMGGLSVFHNRIDHEQQATVTTQNLSRVLDEYINGVITSINLALLTVVDEAERQLASGGINKQSMNAFITRQYKRLPYLEGLRMFNEKGDVLYGTGLVPGQLINGSDRDYFVHPRNDPTGAIFISKPYVGRISGKWAIAFARRFNHPGGSFAGVVFGTVPLAHFPEIFSIINVGKHGTISLFDGELSVIARHPEPRGPGSTVGIKFKSSEIRELFKKKQASATYKVHATIDGIERIYSYRKISDYPIYVQVGLAKDDYLAEWRNETVKMVALVALFVLVMLCLSWLLYRYITEHKLAEEKIKGLNRDLERRISERTAEHKAVNKELQAEIVERKNAEEKLLEITQRFQLATASARLGIWDWNVITNEMVWDDRMLELYGHTRESFPGGVEAWERGLHPDDHDRTWEECQASLRGEREWDTEFRVLHPDGTVKHIKANGIVIRNSEGAAARMLGINQDISERKVAEETLRLHSEITKNMSEGVQLVRLSDGLIVYTNPKFEKIFGYDTGEMIGRHVSILNAPTYKKPEDTASEIIEVLLGTGEWRGEVNNIRKDGTLFWTYASCSLLDHSEYGRVLISVQADITDRKKAEEKLARAYGELERRVQERTEELQNATEFLLRSEKLLNETQLITKVGGWEYDVASRKLYWTKEVYNIYQVPLDYDQNDLVQTLGFYDDAHMAILKNAFERAVSDGEPYDLELPLKTGENHHIWVRTTGHVEKQDNRVVRVYGNFMDITERRNAEENLAASEREFRLLAEAMPQIVWITRADGWNIYFNHQWVDYTGLTLEEGYGHGWNKPFHPDDQKRAWDAWQNAVTNNGTYSLECRMRRADGVYLWWLIRGVPVFNEQGKITKWFGTCTNIQDIKQTEEQLKQSLKEKETLLREIHHRVKNNMAVVSSLLSLQAGAIKDPTVKRLLEESQQRVKSMALVHEKLYGTKDLTSINFKDYINSLIQAIVTLYHINPSLITTEINIEDIELDLESAVPCGLIINELLTNAFKYAFPDNRSGELCVNFAKSDNTYRLTIKDNGVGLPEGFDFKTTSSLGLKIVNVLTKQLRGTLQITSDKGTEAAVTFTTNNRE
ncbi:MAG: PAS domain-containing protein [Nitrospirae bacterium]|nr:PAS domain-containing protein [Nitrospirota bacterium]